VVELVERWSLAGDSSLALNVISRLRLLMGMSVEWEVVVAVAHATRDAAAPKGVGEERLARGGLKVVVRTDLTLAVFIPHCYDSIAIFSLICSA
jgi:hypothetical protein